MSKVKLILTPLEKAVNSLEEAIEIYHKHGNGELNQTCQDSVIQRFEYTYELAWKMIKRYFKLYETENIETFNMKDLYRITAKKEIITNVEKWFRFHEARNKTSHNYNMDVAEGVFRVAVEFADEAKHLLATLKERTGD